MFGWFRKRTVRLQPEASWIVATKPAHIQVTDHEGQIRRLAKADLVGVAIETNDSGPWGADVWWLLFGASDRLACSFPQGATGESETLDYLTSLPQFNHEQMTQAMCSTENAVFPVWRKES